MPKSTPFINIAYLESLSLFFIIGLLLYSLLNKNFSSLFKEIIESNNPEIYSGNKKNGSPNELNIYKEVNILLILISEEKVA